MVLKARALRVLCSALLGVLFALPAGSAEARCKDWTPQPKPQNASRDIVGQDLDQIQDRGFITFAVYEAFPPYSWEENGKPLGIDVEIGRLIAEALEVEARFNFIAAGETLDADLRNNVWKGPLIGGSVSNVMLHVPYDSDYACRHEQVVFTGQAYAETLAVAYSQEFYKDSQPVPAYFRFDKVAVENDTISDFYLSSFAGGQMKANVFRYPSYVEAIAAMVDGVIPASMGPRGQLEHDLPDGFAVHEPPLPGLAKRQWTVGLAVRHTYRALGYSIDGAIGESLASGRIQSIFAEYGVSFSAPER
ncbi:MAG: amino acid ABC transporter substrate-binding protein [Pseudomonadota bacterium]